MAADDSEGKALMAEPVLGPNAEETEAISTPSKQDTELEGEQTCRGPTAPAGREEVGQGLVGQVVPVEGCLPQQGGSSVEEGTTITESVEEEEEEEGRRRAEEDGSDPVLGPHIPTVPSSPELEGCLPRAKEEDSGDPQGPIAVGTRQERPLGEGAGAGAPISFWEDPGQGRSQQEEAEEEETDSCCIQAEDPSEEQECPICTELYDREDHRPAPLNCGHVICGRCLQAIMEAASAADIGRVRCPICRQKTPMMEWEICRLQEELLLLGATQDPAAGAPTPLFFSPLPTRRPGFWGSLEHHFQVRFHTTRMVGFLPCLRYPPRLIQGLARLEGRCRWGYRLALVSLMVAETLSLLLVFLPIALLLLLFLIMDQ